MCRRDCVVRWRRPSYLHARGLGRWEGHKDRGGTGRTGGGGPQRTTSIEDGWAAVPLRAGDNVVAVAVALPFGGHNGQVLPVSRAPYNSGREPRGGDSGSGRCRRQAPQNTQLEARRNKGSYQLVEKVMEVRALLPSDALEARFDEGLAAEGVDVVDPKGEPFDGEPHRTVEAVDTEDRALVGRVLGTQDIGYRQRTQVLRVPDVIVYSQGQRQ